MVGMPETPQPHAATHPQATTATPSTTPAATPRRPVLGAYPAKQCAHRAHLDHHPETRDLPRDPTDPMMARRAENGINYEDAVVAHLQLLHGNDCVVIDHGDHAADHDRRIAETAAAITARTKIICGGQLPSQPDTGRTGCPDILLLHDDPTADPNTPATYLPVDIKHHRTLTPRKRAPFATVSSLNDPTTLLTANGHGAKATNHTKDAYQLAHYTRMLQTAGLHPGEHMLVGAILGSDDFTAHTNDPYAFTWFNLTEPQHGGAPSYLTAYDTAFSNVVNIARTAAEGHPPHTHPIGKAECGTCPRQTLCRTHAGPDDASFAFRVGRPNEAAWNHLRTLGAHTIPTLATLDPTTHETGYTTAAATERGSRPPALTDVVRRARMIRDNIPLEPRTTPRKADHPPLDFTVPTADIEIDFDVEWHPEDGHVYQWGALIRTHQDNTTADYDTHTAVAFDRLTPATATTLATNFFNDLDALVTAHHTAGRTVRIFHWTSPEEWQTARIGKNGPDPVRNLSERFPGLVTDLKTWVEDRYWARDGYSIKHVAPALAFTWTVDDPGGAVSITKIETARTNHPDAPAARQWLLDYNRSDCAAQAAIRDGLRHGL